MTQLKMTFAPFVLRSVAFATFVYFLLGVLGLLLAIPQGYAAPIFPAAGLAIALVLASNNRQLPAVWLGSLALNFYVGWQQGRLDLAGGLVATAIATGATLQAWVGGALIRRMLPGRFEQLDNELDIFSFLVLSGPIACLVSSSFAVTALQLSGAIAEGDLLWTWWTWWSGDALGVLVFTPLCLMFLSRRSEFWQGRRRTVVLVTATTLFSVVLVFLGLWRWELERQQGLIQDRGQEIFQHLQKHFDGTAESLSALRRFFEVSPDLNFESFEYFTQVTLNDHPEVSALSINAYVELEDRADFERKMRSRLNNEHFQILERGAERNLIRAGERLTYVPVAYIAPLKGNLAAQGYDIASEPIRADAIGRAIMSGQSAITAPITLVQDEKKLVGMLALHPAYRQTSKAAGEAKQLIGFAVAVLKLAEMVQRAVGTSVEPGIIFQLEDAKAEGEHRLLFRSDPGNEPAFADLSWTGSLTMMDRVWDLKVYPDRGWMIQNRSWLSWFAGALGLVLVALFQMLTLASTGRTRIIARKVEEQTARLHEQAKVLSDNQILLRNIIDNIDDPICIKDEHGLCVIGNQALAGLLNTSTEELVGKSDTDLGIPAEKAEEFRQSILETIAIGRKTIVFEYFSDAVTGELHQYRSVKKPLIDSSGRTQVLIIAHDLSELLAEHQRLQLSERRLQNVLEVSREGVWEWDVPTGKVSHNSQWYTLLGFVEGEVSGRFEDFEVMIHPDDRVMVMEKINDLLSGEQDDFDSEHRLQGKNGWLWVHDRGRVMEKSASGSPLRIVGSYIDISVRRAADEAIAARTEELLSILQSDVLGIMTTDDGKVLWANDALTRMQGYTPEEMIGAATRTFFPSEESYEAFEAALLPALQEDRLFRSQMLIQIKAGTPLWCDVSCSRFPGDTGKVIWSIIDISMQKRIENDLTVARNAAENASKAKGEFLAVMSHEIRTPMNGIMGMTELVLASALTTEQREYLELAQTSAKNLLNVINDVLDFSKIEVDKMELEVIQFSPRKLLSNIIMPMQRLATEKGLVLGCEVDSRIPAYLLGDATRLTQILTNLLGNGLKFTEEGGVMMAVDVVPSSDERLCLAFSVSDTGIGIPADRQAAIFDAFSQADTSISRKYGGTGLGLAISQRLVALMGGTLSVESTHGEGSRFSFTAKFERASSPERADEDRAEWDHQHLANLSVLLAEDNLVNQKFAMVILTEAGHEVVLAEDGVSAVELALARKPGFDVILMDVQMPRMDGFEATRAIREAGITTPIIALTAHAMKGFREECLAAGMNDYLTKPVRGSDLRAKLVLLADQGSLKPSSAGAALRNTETNGLVLDIDAAVSLLDGNRDVLKLSLGLVLGQLPSLRSEIAGALTMLNRSLLRSLAHKLRGSLKVIVATRAADACGALEEAAPSAKPDELSRLQAILEAELDQLVLAIKVQIV